MSSFVSRSGREAILEETDPATTNKTIVMQISISPPHGQSTPPGQPRLSYGQDIPTSQAMATTTPRQDLPSPTPHHHQSLASEIPISYTMAKLTRQPSPPLPLIRSSSPTHLIPHQHRALTTALCKAAQSINLHTTTPLAFLDQITILHNNLSTAPTSPIPPTIPPTIYDKLTLLPLLFHQNRILLLIPPRSTTGYKPPAYTYNATNTHHNTIDICNITKILETMLLETLRLHPKRTFMPLVQAIHEPCFGAYRLPSQSVDIWVVAVVFELSPIPEVEVLRMRIANAGRVGMSDGTAGLGMGRIRGWPRWNPNPDKVQVMKWFDEDMVRGSREIDGLTKRILYVAFEGMRRVERDVEAAMSML